MNNEYRTNGTSMTSAITTASSGGMRMAVYYLLLGSNASAITGSIVASGLSRVYLGAICYNLIIM